MADDTPRSRQARAAAEEALVVRLETPLKELEANFADEHSQGPKAYANQMMSDDPSLDRPSLIAESIVAVAEFCEALP